MNMNEEFMHFVCGTRMLNQRDKLERMRVAGMDSEGGFPNGDDESRYVIITTSDDWAWSLNRSYSIHEDLVPVEVVQAARLRHVDVWQGWKPSMAYQIPTPFRNLRPELFTAFWIAL